MDLQKQQILNRLVKEVPEGLPVNARWLKDNIGCSRQLVQIYVKNNWLDNPCRGVYVRNIEKMTWQSTLLSLQQVYQLKCYPAGATALQLSGFIQYLPFKDAPEVLLRGKDAPPLWLKKLQLPAMFHYVGRQLFKDSTIGMTEYRLPGFLNPLKISSPPKAFLEVLAEVVDQESFNAAYEIFESMTTLNPSLVNSLLAVTKNIKVKRLFFLMSDKAGHQWSKRVDSRDFYLGRGKRGVVKNGRLNHKYAITVPDGFND